MDIKNDLIEEKKEKKTLSVKNIKKAVKKTVKKTFKKILCVEQHLPHILEIHQDNTRNRILFILVSVLVYCFATFLIFNLDVKVF